MTRTKHCSSQSGCNNILVNLPEKTQDVYPKLSAGDDIALKSATEDFVKVTNDSMKFTKAGCYGFGLWCNILPQWVISPEFYDTIRERIVQGINKSSGNIFRNGITESKLDNLSPTKVVEHARTVLAHYVFALLNDDGVATEDLDKYLGPSTFRINNDLLLLVRERQGEEALIVSTFGTRQRINQDPKASGPLNTVDKVRNSYLGAPIFTERYYHVQDVEKGDKFVYRSLNGTFRFSREKISTGRGTGTNFNPVFLYITELQSEEKKKQKDCCKDGSSSGIVYFL